MKRLIVTVLLLGLIVLTTPQIFAATLSTGSLSIGGTTVVLDGMTTVNSGPGWIYHNQVLTLNDYHGSAIVVDDIGELVVVLTPGTTNIITGPSATSDGAGIAVGANSILIIQGAIGATLDVIGSGTMETGIFGASNTANIIFSMADVNIIGVEYCVFSYGAVELQNSSTIVFSSPHIGICLSGAPLTINHSVLNSSAPKNSIVIDQNALIIENDSTVTALSTGADGINVINGAILISHSTVNAKGLTGINAMGSIVSISNESDVTTVSAEGEGIYADQRIEISDSAVEAVGRGQSGLFSFGEISMTGSQVTASSPDGVSILAETGNVSISGGTIIAPEGISADAITLTGGSLNAPALLVMPQPVDSQGMPIYKTTITLPGLPAAQPVTKMIGSPEDYRITGMITGDDGVICPWLSADSVVTEVTAGEQQFVGQVPGGSSGNLTPTAAIVPAIANINTTLISGKGASASLTITATGNPAPTFSALMASGDPLPSWITLNAASGVLTATPTSDLVPGDYVVRVTAANSAGSATKDITVRVEEVPPTGDDGTVYFTGLSALLALLSLGSMAIWRRNARGCRN